MSFDRNLLPEPASYYESQGLRLTGPRSAKWMTTACPFHGGSDSMRINLRSGGFCCMNCGARGGDVLAFEMALNGSEFVEAARRLGAWVDNGKTMTSASMRPAPLSPRAALEVLGFESLLVAVAAGGKGLVAEESADLHRALARGDHAGVSGDGRVRRDLLHRGAEHLVVGKALTQQLERFRLGGVGRIGKELGQHRGFLLHQPLGRHA